MMLLTTCCSLEGRGGEGGTVESRRDIKFTEGVD